ncbi:autotransporter outer membrane beta-barrel domain-containing protein [Microbulbifer variabilis]|uniref:autotransporter outer membrane beta-barrel domain-containing protein n=1 Tax=Microbulbifer variabilis TaxID=266805 RepID=UPI001CFD589F|nr:autotransporter outer membrane beta-barrel domain-containing protein [Microbulbifer variabilis]
MKKPQLCRKLLASFFQVFPLIPVTAVYLANIEPARADCTVSGTTATCTGDITETIEYTDGSVTEVILEDQTSALSADDGIILTDIESDGEDASELIITIEESDYGIDVTDTAIEIIAEGGDGESASGTSGAAGEAGGMTNEVSVTIDDAPVTAGGAGILGISYGGSGGDGAFDENELDETTGGAGGAGGVAASVVIELSEEMTFISQDGIGIQASVKGGDGGNGGDANTNFFADSYGGAGGDGGEVAGVNIKNVDSSGEVTGSISITSSGDYDHGIVAELVGGDGGQGGIGSGDTSYGGDGGNGGVANDADVTLEEVTITTSGEEAQGLLVRSYGGAGGAGGQPGVAFSVNGADGTAAAGGEVNIAFTGSITTSGTEARAMLFQSVGGFSGDGGDAGSSFNAYGANTTSAEADGGAITVSIGSGSSLTTTGDVAPALTAHSVGGSGGAGSSSNDISALGSSGSSGGDGGEVNVTIDDASFSTATEKSTAILLQSIGGGGGSGGSSTGITAVGGSGGSGGDGGEVFLTVSEATITTADDNSYGISIASIGGGGGTAGSASGIESVGGTGGDGGSGDKVQLEADELTITTEGDDSDAILIQSLGGGGGDGGGAFSLSAEFSAAYGGTGGDGGTGGEVIIKPDTDSSLSITTSGSRSSGIVAHSIGGGGGTGGADISISAGILVDVDLGMSGGGGNGADADSVTVDIDADVMTSGNHSKGIEARSVGGGGGSAGYDISVSDATGLDFSFTTGGTGGEAGDGEEVTVDISGSITTTGDFSSALVAESIGGGGGDSSYSFNGTGWDIGSLEVTQGGSGGEGGDGNEVNVTSSSTISTDGYSSHGIYALSLGGGGGDASWAFSGDAFEMASVNVAVGGEGGDGGDGDQVCVVTESESITVMEDQSYGIYAQSIGGNGGSSSFTIAGDVSGGASVNLSTGGDGGADGNADNVEVTSASTIKTEGDSGFGIFAQSVAGTGGSAGMTVSGSVVEFGNVEGSVEGSGGDGGSSGTVTVNNTGSITTEGNNAIAIYANSNGGGGGSATGSISASGLTMDDVTYAIGGNGGTSGTGGDVSVTSSGTLSTEMPNATGIKATSTGGDGGNGGFAFTGGLDASEYVAGNVSVTVGGDAGSGNTGGGVTIDNTGDITTSDIFATGITAVSTGGSGGTGGSVYSGQIEASSGYSADVDVTIGGDGGDSGQGGDVKVTNYGTISTSSFYSHSIFAKSVGGNGGSGGSAYTVSLIGTQDGSISFDLSLGGSGGEGAVAGEVTVDNYGELTTVEGSSDGIHASSIGGNGGTGGNAGSIIIDITTDSAQSLAAISATIDVGGSGGSGADADTVTVNNYESITTSGEVASGIFAQSVGGGGGAGGSASSYVVQVATSSDSGSNDTDFELTVSIGGDGEGGGDGEDVNVTNTETLTTSGIASHGIFAQSIGGGGGTGGDGGGGIQAFTSNDVADDIATFISAIDTVAGFSLTSLVADYEIEVGGSAGVSGDAGAVTVTNSGDITTSGDSGAAIVALSVGGGGGSGGDGSGGFLTKVALAEGGSGGGDGDDVTITNSGTISTSGKGAMGIYVQSVGGGGGTAGDPELGLGVISSELNIGLGVAASGDSGDGGNAGDVTICVDGEIITSGDYAHGVWAQSIGGGGGAAGSEADDTYLGGSAGAGGNGGKVTVETTEEIEVSGEWSVGIFAQSVGGVSGDNSNSNYDNTAGDVEIIVGDDISATGTSSRAILAQSQGSESSGSISITIKDDAEVLADRDADSAIVLIDGDSNTITIEEGSTLVRDLDNSGGFGYTVDATGGTVTIQNAGTFTGSVSLDFSYDQYLTNESTGTLQLGTNFSMGDDSTTNELKNEGLMTAGFVDEIWTSDVAVKLIVQDTSGILWVDYEMGDSEDDGSADLISTSLEAILNGFVEPNIISGTNLLTSGESGTVTIFKADEVYSDIGLSIDSDSVTVSYALDFNDDETELYMTYTVDYSASTTTTSSDDDSDSATALGANASGQTTLIKTRSPLSKESLSFVSYLDKIIVDVRDTFDDGSDEYSDMSDMTTLFLKTNSTSDLDTYYREHNPNESGASGIIASRTVRIVHDLLNSCPNLDHTSLDQFMLQESCEWGMITGNNFDQDRTNYNPGYDEHWVGLMGGVQREIRPKLLYEVAVGFDRFWLDDTNFKQDGYRLQGGGAIKKEIGETTLSAMLSAGLFDYNYSRSYHTYSGSYKAKSSPFGGFIGGELRASKVFTNGDYLIKPAIGLMAMQVWQESFREKGKGDFNWSIDNLSKGFAAVRPAVEFGESLNYGDLSGIIYTRFGVTAFLNDPDVKMDARYSSFDGALSTFGFDLDNDRVYGEFSAGLELTVNENFILSFIARGAVSENTRQAGGSVQLRHRF